MADRPDPATPAQSRPGGRSARVREDVIRATNELLLELPPSEVTLHAIAKRSGVHHTTLYRRWGSLPALLLDAVSELTTAHVPLPDLGSIQADLEAQFRAVTGAWREPRIEALVRGLVAAPSEESRAGRTEYWDGRAAAIGVLVSRAQERRELPRGVDPWTLLELTAAPLWMRFLVTHRPIDDEVIATAVRRALQIAIAEAAAH